MHESRSASANGRSLTEVILEIRDEVSEFVQTRSQLLAAELRERLASSGKAAVYGAVAIVLLGTGFLLLTLALVGLVAVAFWGSPYAWFFAFLIVAVVWLSLGAMMALGARRSFSGITPKKTLEILRKDKIWLRSEVQD
jgi:uncharacterized membrane protein YqjE